MTEDDFYGIKGCSLRATLESRGARKHDLTLESRELARGFTTSLSDDGNALSVQREPPQWSVTLVAVAVTTARVSRYALARGHIGSRLHPSPLRRGRRDSSQGCCQRRPHVRCARLGPRRLHQ